MTALDDLITAVEAGQSIIADFDAAFPNLSYERGCARKADQSDLNAAMVLQDALLPGSFWWRDEDGTFCVGDPPGLEYAHANHTIPARAWLLAILRAYRATQEKPE